MYGPIREHVRTTLREIDHAGRYRYERPLDTPQDAVVDVAGSRVINLCANNYLGFANHPRIVAAAKAAVDRWGFGVAGGRPVCGTQTIHQQLERRICEFIGTADAVLFSSCYDANSGLFEPLLGAEDAIISDALNHASIIDGIRLCKARRYRYRNRDLSDLEVQLRRAADARFRLIATDGVFSMEGHVAPLAGICDLADQYDALVMVDDSHAVGVVGPTGRGTPELHGVQDRVDIVTGTFGKALGGACGGYVAGRAEIVELLRQRSRPYLFSNSLAPAIVGAALAALDLVSADARRLTQLAENTAFLRSRLAESGFAVPPGDHPTGPVMVGDAGAADRMARCLLDQGVLAAAFTYPVVPVGAARIRAQVSAVHTRSDLDRAARAFVTARDREAGHHAAHGPRPVAAVAR